MRGDMIWPGLGGYRDMAAGLLASHGYDPEEHREVVVDLEATLGEDILDAVADVMREHGLLRENEYAMGAE
jgi:hypothetical protein